MTAQRDRAWVGVDVGKTHHWACVVDADGKKLLSIKVTNDEADILALIATAGSQATQLDWAVDIVGAPSALLLALLARQDQSVRYASGRVVAAMSAAYAGEGKTDAKDAYVIAETTRLRRDLSVIDTNTDLIRNLAVLTGYRADLIADRVRMINRLRDLMTSVFPSLERAFDYSSHKGALILLTGYATPDRIRRIGQTRLTSWLRTRHVRGSADVATRATTAAKAQTVALPGQDLTASIITELATAILALDDRLKTLDAQIEMTFAEHPQAAIIQSMPGFGPFLGASLLVAANDLRAFPSAGHLAAAAGLVPVPNDSGRRTGNLHRPLRYSRSLRHVFYLSAQTSMMRAGPNRDYYLKKRAHGATHAQAVIALARRRIDVLWALLRENRTWTASPPPLVQAA
ncbi:IS110 family transposase [Mycobacterium kiyosense]|uniref:IS110 family transposase n=1 Tax=Mycobacterium kiyosense TaxID=2871094 RepID=A0AA37QAV7_9MYCO|nr:IS110 family transposase [Mycobacterium kiyosense]GLB86949.1 IS110 family transposase [Mycobacterium kiyosense]GLB99353.1 IS110 family transposase [Mycobacterium kiyosense]GLD45468.1 IS110 family transposase [Mycobacterium kiyosense]